MREIPLTRGKVAKVDDEYCEELANRKWYCTASGYAVRDETSEGRRSAIYMHKIVAGCTGIVDHINGDRLDNQKSNLRPATNALNLSNRPKQANNTSGYKGVSWSLVSEKWGAEITVSGVKYWLGLHESKEEAARAYNEKAIELLGEFAHLNVILEEAV